MTLLLTVASKWFLGVRNVVGMSPASAATVGLLGRHLGCSNLLISLLLLTPFFGLGYLLSPYSVKLKVRIVGFWLRFRLWS